MTVSTEVDHNDYTGNGVTTSFPYTFRIFKKSDLTVQVADLNDNITVLTLDTDYSVTGAGTYSGGNVVLMSPLANGWQISISRDLPVTQETDLRNQGKFFAEVHEDAFDKLTMLIQQCFSFLRLALRKPSFIANYYDALNNRIRNLRDPSQAQDAATKNYVDETGKSNLARTLRVPESSITPLPSIAGRKKKILAFNDQGNPIAVLPESGSATDVIIEIGSSDGFKLVGQVPSYSDLQSTIPEYEGQRILLAAHRQGTAYGGGEFIARYGDAVDDGGIICVPVPGRYWERVCDSGHKLVDWFGADPTGAEYSSDAIRAAFEAYDNVSFQGVYKYHGGSIDKGSYDIEGNGSRIIFDDGVQWFVCTGTIGRIYVHDLYLQGGYGYFSFKDATANSFNDIRRFMDLNMSDYTGTAIRYTDRDCPWWLTKRCMFSGRTNEGTIGLWDNGSDTNVVAECKFYKNQYHVTTRLGSGSSSITFCDFGQFFTTGSSVNRANIWIRVPKTIPVPTGVTGMFIVEANKFGNENEQTNDVKLLLANVGPGDMPDYTSYSGALPASHIDFGLNYFAGNGSTPAHWMRSVGGWMPQTFSLTADNLQFADISKGKYFCYIDFVTRATPYSIYVRRKAHRDSQVLWRGNVSNDPLINFSLIDPSLSIAAGDPFAHSPYSSGIGNGTIDITQQKLPNVTYAGNGMTIVAVSDLLGKAEAVQGNYSTRYNNIFQSLKTVTDYQPGFIQGEIKIADDAVFDTAVYLIDYAQDTGDQVIYNQFPLQLRKGVWTSYCFPVMFMANVSTHCLVLKPNFQDTTTYPNKVVWSRSRAYLGKTPGLVGVQQMGGIILNELPISPTGLPSGTLWVDTTNGYNIVKQVI
ncbi:hypothetical protein [Klebsiella pneumoniae]|uniref:hypothetical protein n=1 Tax=Klebsiella pneumoniae TaxID=573 RepID=UPI000AFE15DB|nr:hypothetical protein [Klebsiella pneumoniae]